MAAWDRRRGTPLARTGPRQETQGARDASFDAHLRSLLDQVRVGQIISFEAPLPGRPIVTHRVIQIVSGGAHPRVRTQGDANTTPDPWIARLTTGPLWQARATVPGVGTIIRTMRSRWIHFTTVGGAPVLFLGLALIAIWKPKPRPLVHQPMTPIGAET